MDEGWRTHHETFTILLGFFDQLAHYAEKRLFSLMVPNRIRHFIDRLLTKAIFSGGFGLRSSVKMTPRDMPYA